MNYFEFLTRSRQAVLCCSMFGLLLTATPLMAQEKAEIKTPGEIKTKEKNIESDNKKTVEDESKPEEKDQAKVIPAKFTARIFSDKVETDSVKPERPKFNPSSFLKKNDATEAESQHSSGDDDTMMGVMGKGTDSIKLGGHVGFVVPIVARGNGVTTNVGDRFVFGFPVGLTLKTRRNIAIDFEFIPTFNTGRDFVLTIHPGIIYGFAKHYAVGVRAAYDAGAGSFGFTPLVSRGFKINDKVGFFIEADFPIRSNYRPYRDRFGSIAFAAHAGFSF